MSALVKYYAFMVLVFVVILIYNIAFYSTFQTFNSEYWLRRMHQRQPKQLHPHQYLYLKRLNKITLPLIIVIVYGIMAGLMVIAMLGIVQFADMPSERFGNLPWYWACCGFYVRNFAMLIKIASYVVLLLIAIQACLVLFAPDCDLHTGELYNQALMVVIIDACFWGFTHCILPLVKNQLDQEAFLYEPFDSSGNMAYYVLCNLFGP